MPETSEEKLAPQTRDVKLPQGLEEVLAFKSKWATQQVRHLKLFLVCSRGDHVKKCRHHAKCPQLLARGGRGSKLSKVWSTYLVVECPLKFSKFEKQIFLFSFEPKTERNYS